MQPIHYHRGKLMGAAVACLIFAGICVWPIYDPAVHLPGSFGRLLDSGFGHFVIAPLLVLGAALLAWRLALMTAESTEALSVDAEGVHITTLWRTTDIAWSDLILARLIEQRTRYGKRYYFCFDRRSASSVRLTIGLTTLPKAEYRDYLVALGDWQYRQAHRRPGVPAPAAIPEPIAAIAPAVRGFGRRGVTG